MVSFLLFGVFFPIIYYFLRNILFSEWILVIGIATIAFIATNILTKIILHFIPRINVNPLGKAVFITGCDSGFGFGLAKRLDSLGFYVYAGCLLPDEEGAKELERSCSKKLKIIKIDVTSDNDVKAAVEEVESSLNGKILWSIVNNAGLSLFTEIEWCPLESFNYVLNVNAMGLVRVTKSFLPLLKKSQGRVVFTSSLAVRCVTPGFTAYSMSKSAGITFADGLRKEMKKWNISVHIVEPFIYKTNAVEINQIKKGLQYSWESTPVEIKESYGENYYQAMQECVPNILLPATDNLDDVVNDLTDAVVGTTPKIRYVPNLSFEFQDQFFQTLPTEIQDFILGFYQPSVLPAKSIVNPGIESLQLLLRRYLHKAVWATARMVLK